MSANLFTVGKTYKFIAQGDSYQLQLLVADKIHCVWLKDGVTKVLFECDKFPGPDHLGVATRSLIENQTLVDQYLLNNDFVPHFTTNIDTQRIN